MIDLKLVRRDQGMTQKQVASSVGISESHYCMMESGRRRPSVEIAKKIADVLGFDWTWFYEDPAAPVGAADDFRRRDSA